MSHSRRYFYPRPPRGGRRRRKAFAHTRKEFLSTPSARRATKDGSDPIFIDSISIHALREEGDDGAGCATIVQKYFYPRPPRGGRPEQVPVMQNDKGISIHALREEGDHRQHWPQPWCPYFYPRPPRGGRLSVSANCSLETFISIHALREEGDTSARGSYFFVLHFYPRPPRGGRLRHLEKKASRTRFLSTPSARRATCPAIIQWAITDISIHALREEGDSFPNTPPKSGTISIHALREEGDAAVNDLLQRHDISIHALREEGDAQSGLSIRSSTDFYPRPPRGGRPEGGYVGSDMYKFLSTPSARRATSG